MTTYWSHWRRWVCVTLLIILPGIQAYAANPRTTTVYPTGSTATDVKNVQLAINLGGTVVLKAVNIAGQPTAFDFGLPDLAHCSGVDLTTDVSLLGEQVGPFMTTIKGGCNPIIGDIPVKSRIQGIDFEGPLNGAISLIASTGADIVGNRIRGVVPQLLSLGFTDAEGMVISGNDDPQNGITGRVTVSDNTIELSGGDFSNGIQFDGVFADIDITRINVQFLQSNGVIENDGILVFRSHGKANITRNLVTMGPGGPDVFPSGMFLGGHAEARYTVMGNIVITSHPNADAIDVVGLRSSGPTQQALVTNNHVVMNSLIPTAGGIAFFGAVKSSLIVANTVEGTSGNAIQILGLSSTLTADSNSALGNDISRLSPLDVDVFFGPDSNNNLFAGRCDTYVDLGIGNRILCGTNTGSAASTMQTTNRPVPAIDLLGDAIRRARFDAMRKRLAR